MRSSFIAAALTVLVVAGSILLVGCETPSARPEPPPACDHRFAGIDARIYFLEERVAALERERARGPQSAEAR